MTNTVADTDIDIDFYDRSQALKIIKHVPATLIGKEGEARPHNVGVYFQDIPTDPFSGRASISTKEAEQRGYFKFDFLNVSLYKGVRDEQHLDDLIGSEPIWEMLEDPDIVGQLWHIHGHFDILKQHPPKSIEQLAMVLAIIRPAKRHLVGKTWPEIEKDVWVKPQPGDNGYKFVESFFKKSHSFAYSLGIVVQMNLMVENSI